MPEVKLNLIWVKWEHYLCRNCDLAFKQQAHNHLHLCPRCGSPEHPQLLDISVESYPAEPVRPAPALSNPIGSDSGH
jgi:hypothetical protein